MIDRDIEKKDTLRRRYRYVVFVIIMGVLLTLTNWITSLIWFDYWYPKQFEASLKLCDDASLPEDKAKYLRDYLDKINTITGPPRYIFKRPDLDLEKQKQILRGLIQRFEDIAKISPSEMAYQQGMYQLTEQEMGHQLERISDIFKSAKLRENLLLFMYLYFGWCAIPIIFLVWVIYLIKKAGRTIKKD